MSEARQWLKSIVDSFRLMTYKASNRFRRQAPVWFSRLVESIAILGGAVVAGVLIWKGPFWFDSGLIEAIRDPEEKAQAAASARATLLQIALVFGGFATIIFTARSYLLAKSGQVADRYTNAATQLVSQSAAERIGAIYALARLMRDSPRDHRAVVDLLAGFIRESRPLGEAASTDSGLEIDGDYESGLHWIGPELPIDVQTALTALGKRPKRYDSPWILLGDTDLAGARMVDNWVEMLHFRGSNLRGADLVRVKAVRGAAFAECDLRAANLSGAKLPVSHFSGSDLRGALIRWVDLRGAIFDGADMRGAVLRGSNLRDVSLTDCDLRGIDLTEVKGIKLEQIAEAMTDEHTILPDYLGE